MVEFDPYEHGTLDGDDPYLERQARSRRMRTIVAILLVVGLGGGFVLVRTAKERRVTGITESVTAGLLRSDFGSVNRAAHELSEAIGKDERADGRLLAINAVVDLVLYTLYTGQTSQRYHALELLDTAEERLEKGAPEVAVGRAMAEAFNGSPEAALALLPADTGSVPQVFAALARAEAAYRVGDFDGARAALDGRNEPLARAWAARLGWLTGQADTAQAAATSLGQAVPGHEVARAIGALTTARAQPDAEAERTLAAVIERGEPLPSRLAALVSVETARVLQRNSGPDRAEEFLASALEVNPDSPLLSEEFARLRRFQGSFGAARTRADKALRTRSEAPGLLTELATSAWFMDAAGYIDDRVSRVPKGAEKSDGVRRARAMQALAERNAGAAIADLETTRHLGAPGEADLWIAEARLALNDPAGAREAAAAAAVALEASMGAGTAAPGVARMLEALAATAAGDEEAGRELAEAAYRKPAITPWTAWIYGRLHEARKDPAAAKDAYLLACHNGQDFARACFDLARIYDSLSPDAVARRTQREAWRSYLRASPDGVRAAEVRAALGD